MDTLFLIYRLLSDIRRQLANYDNNGNDNINMFHLCYANP